MSKVDLDYRDYGWLSTQGGRQNGAAASGYHYGWPSGGTAEPDVLVQFLFDEAAQPIVDEITSLSLTSFGGGFVYSVAASGSWSGLSPGITYLDGGVTGTHYSNSSGSSFKLGTGDATIEYVYKSTSSSAIGYVFGTSSLSDSSAYTILHRSNITKIQVFIYDATGATNNAQLTVGSSMNDADIHKVRVTLDRSGNAELFFDGVSKGTFDISAVSGAVDPDRVRMGADVAVSASVPATLYEFRISGNLTNNSGGPGGG